MPYRNTHRKAYTIMYIISSEELAGFYFRWFRRRGEICSRLCPAYLHWEDYVRCMPTSCVILRWYEWYWVPSHALQVGMNQNWSATSGGHAFTPRFDWAVMIDNFSKPCVSIFFWDRWSGIDSESDIWLSVVSGRFYLCWGEDWQRWEHWRPSPPCLGRVCLYAEGCKKRFVVWHCDDSQRWNS